eukprot:2888910-Pleurochrysis_carterae.AAC.3
MRGLRHGKYERGVKRVVSSWGSQTRAPSCTSCELVSTRCAEFKKVLQNPIPLFSSRALAYTRFFPPFTDSTRHAALDFSVATTYGIVFNTDHFRTISCMLIFTLWIRHVIQHVDTQIRRRCVAS